MRGSSAAPRCRRPATSAPAHQCTSDPLARFIRRLGTRFTGLSANTSACTIGDLPHRRRRTIDKPGNLRVRNPKTSRSTKTVRSTGARVSITTIMAVLTDSDSTTSSAMSGIVMTGSGSQGPTCSSRLRARPREALSACLVRNCEKQCFVALELLLVNAHLLLRTRAPDVSRRFLHVSCNSVRHVSEKPWK